jgi:hypothetical protein
MVLFVIVSVPPPNKSIPPPLPPFGHQSPWLPWVELPLMVLFTTVNEPPAAMPPPKHPAVLSLIVLLATVSAPELSMPPPVQPG